jgi:hypothetical protein
MNVIHATLRGVELAAQKIEATLKNLEAATPPNDKLLATQIKELRKQVEALKALVPSYSMEYNDDEADRYFETLRVELQGRKGTALTYAMQMFTPDFFQNDTPKFNGRLKTTLVEWFGETSADHWRMK